MQINIFEGYQILPYKRYEDLTPSISVVSILDNFVSQSVILLFGKKSTETQNTPDV